MYMIQIFVMNCGSAPEAPPAPKHLPNNRGDGGNRYLHQTKTTLRTG